MVIRHRVLAVGAAVIVLGVLLGVASGIRVGEAHPNSLARSGTAEQGILAIEHAGFPVGVVAPIEALVPDHEPTDLAGRLAAIPGVDTAICAHRTGVATVRHRLGGRAPEGGDY